MKTKEEIVENKGLYHYVDEYGEIDSEGLNNAIYAAMEDYAKQEALAFMSWKMQNEWVLEHTAQRSFTYDEFWHEYQQFKLKK